jgi:methyl-accepting chemotaxis protein
MKKIFSLTITQKLCLLAACVALAITVLTTVFLISERSLILDERKNSVRQAVEAAHSILGYYQGQAQKGAMSETDAKQAAANAVQALRYGDGEYFWINDMDVRMVMHPTKPELNGSDVSGTQDPNGKHLFAESVKVVKESGSGFVMYEWPMPGQAQAVPKVSYVKGFAPWGWMIGSGVYLNTVDEIFWRRFVEYSAGATAFMLVLLGFFFILARSIAGPIKTAVSVAKTVAAGDLTSRFEIQGQDETAQLLTALQDMNHSLAHIVNEVRDGTEMICAASEQIASGNLDLSSRTESQASSLQETAASMEQLTATVKQNADHARQANGLAVSAAGIAQQGGTVVAQVVDTMSSINQSSHKIVDIISVIDSIAFQTNILALNAAVEAARAGEQGRGFAVVASEVRSLAQRSAEAARQVKTLIDDSVAKVDSGAKLVDQAGATMQQIVTSIQHVTDIMGEISRASVEQTTGIEQVNQAVAQMDEVTQQNAALVEQSAAAAQSMLDKAKTLSHAVGVFKLNGTTLAQLGKSASHKIALSGTRTYPRKIALN